MKYRPDIDGLRAVAVLPVLMFHAGVPGFSGGFVGVDVFFVISGYLITKIIAGEVDQGEFSLWRFYERRIRRIIPALFAVLLATSVAASIVLLPEDFEEFGHSLIATIFFSSNILFWQQSGYFEGAAEIKPLLHTWSLAVEEQFYIFFPLLLLALARWRQKLSRKLVLYVFALLSLILSLYGVSASPVATFFLAPTRAWELLCGSLLAIAAVPALRSRLSAELAALIGLAMIVVSVLLYSDRTVFPGAAALLPCLGASLLIHSGSRHRTRVGSLLSARPIVAIGLISYSLYLWHWPLMALCRYQIGRDFQLHESLALVVLALVASALSWKFVEQPFRSRASVAVRPLLAGYGALTSLLLLVGVYAHLTGGWRARFPDYQPVALRGLEDYRKSECFLEKDQAASAWNKGGNCVHGDAGGAVLLWGDSFAAHYVPGLEQMQGSYSGKLIQYNAAACPPILDYESVKRPKCRVFNNAALALIPKQGVDTVILAARWELYWDDALAEALQATINKLKAEKLKVVLVLQSPTFFFDRPYDYMYKTGLDTAVPKPEYLQINARLRRLTGYDAVFDPASLLCERIDACKIVKDREFIYWDAGHFTSAGSLLVGRSLLSTLSDTGAGLRWRTSSVVGGG